MSTALHEIAVEAAQGCSLPKLWTGLQGAAAALEIDLDARVKQMLWKQVLHVPRITFLIPNLRESQTVEAGHPSIQLVEEAEKLGVHVVAPEGLRESCLGLYDGKLCDAAISRDQRELLERLAKARSQGVTQSQLGKEFKTGGNKMFYVVKSLESRGLVVRHATIVRTHQPSVKGSNNKFVPIVATNLVHLSRYEKDQNLGSHARYEIPSSSKSNLSHNSVSGSGNAAAGEEDANHATEEVLINDDYPAMQRICEKLESAEDKVMVVSDLKLDLNYRFAQGHRSWRRLAKRLQDAGMVEIFNAQIAGSKIAPCIRLLKSFNTKAFSAGSDDTEAETQLRGVKRGQVTDQVVESVLDRQIYDLIDNSGPSGLYMMDIWKQLGLNNKRNYFRVTNMLAKGCIVSEAEQHKKSMLYRLRTAPNAFQPASNPTPADQEPHFIPPLAQIAPPSAVKIRRTRKPSDKEKEKEKGKEKEKEESLIEDNTEVLAITNISDGPEKSNNCRILDLSIVKVDEDEPLVETFGQMYPFPLQTTTAIQREFRIMQRLNEEKFIPRVELHRWIEESEKDRKDTMMDRKTLTRLLQKLQREGRVKCIVLSMPGLTNCGRSRQSEVVLLPEVQVGPDLLAKVHDRIRQFDMINRGYGSSKAKADASSVPVLASVKQIHKGGKRKFQPTAEIEAEKARTLSENGFVPAKMVRVRMLHTFLWSYVNGISEYADDELVMKPDESSCRVFSLALAVKAMPVDLFLQVVGSTKSTEELEPYTNKGLRLCDLPESESSSLLVSHANSRLSWLIDILRRLKLIRLVMGTGLPLGYSKSGFSRGSTYSLEASLIYAMEIQPYIEEPAPQPLSSLSLDAFDLTPRARHEFTLTSSEILEAYWQTLEYFFSGAVPRVARKAFPGASVPELFGLRSWTSLRIMTSEQRKRLMKRVEEGGENKRLSHAECLQLARELNLSPEQVLRVSYEKNRRYRLQQLGRENMDSGGRIDNEVSSGHRIKPNIHAGSKKRAVTDADLMEVAHVRAYKRQRQLEQASAAEDASASTGFVDTLLVSNKEGETNEPNEEEAEEDEEEDKGTEENPFNYLKTISKLKPTRSKRFPWSESLDRVLIRCYTRQRAILGARNHRVEWATIPSLPANPAACRRRMAQLKSDPAIRKALMNLCSILSARFMRQEDVISKSKVKETNTEIVAQPNSDKDTDANQLELAISNSDKELPWDSFEYFSVAKALNEVMQLRNIAKAISSKRSSVFRSNVPKHPGNNVPTSLSSLIQDDIQSTPRLALETVDPSGADVKKMDRNGDSATTSRGRQRAPRVRKRKKSEKPASLGEMTSEEMVRKSLGIANAVELVKMVLLNAASAEVPSELVDALRRCEESHVFAAFNYLRYQEYVIVGGNSQPFILSQKFYHNASASRFPSETGLEALGATQWLTEHVSEVDEDWVPLPTESLCGQLIQLLGIVSEGEMNIAPFLPKEGVGESEDNKIIVLGTKRKTEGGQEIQFMKPKIQRSDSSSPGFRRERGFPGIQVCIHRARKPVGELVDAVISQSQDLIHHHDQFNDDMDLDQGQTMVSTTKSVPEPTDAMEVDEPVLSADLCESAVTTKVDVVPPSSVGDVFKSTEVAEVDVAMPSAVDVPASTEAQEVTSAVPSAVVSESSKTADCNVVVAGSDTSSKLVSCIHHFCSTSADPLDASKGRDSKLTPVLLKAATHAVEKAGTEGIDVQQLTNLLERMDHELTEDIVETYVTALETFDVVRKVNAYDHVRVIAAVHSSPFFIHVKATKGENGFADADASSGGSGKSCEKIAQGFTTIATLNSIAIGSRNWTSIQPNLPKDDSNHRRVMLSASKNEDIEAIQTVPMLPWLAGDGSVNRLLLKSLLRRVIGIVMLNPGILEEHLVDQLHVLNPQTAKELLQMLEYDGHVIVKKLLRSQPPTPPGVLGHLIKSKTSGSTKPTYGLHYYANCTSATLL